MKQNTSPMSAFESTATEGPRLSPWPWQMVLAAAGVAVLLAAGFAAVAAVSANEGGLTAWDRQVTEGLVAARGDAWTYLLWAFTLLGNTPVLAMLTVLATLTLLLWGRRGQAVFIAAAVLSATGLSHLFKALLGRTRPEQALALIETPTSYSLPSGHALVTAVFLVGLVVLAWNHRSRRFRVGVLMTALVVAVLVGLSRVYLGVHWTSDVLAGWCLAGVWSVLLATLLHVWRRSSWWLPMVKPWRGLVWRSALVTILVAALAAIVALEAAADPLMR